MRHADKADAVILDLEDGLAHTDLFAGRERVRASLKAAPGRYWVRPHSPRTPEFSDDVGCLSGAAGLLLPKVEAPVEVLAAAELGVPLIVMVESARGLLELSAVVRASSLVVGIAFGSEDFSASLGLPPLAAERQGFLNHARRELVLCAAAFGLKVRLDSPVLSLDDTELVQTEATRSRGTGFSGVLAIHPAQVQAIRAGFTPTPAEIAWRQSLTAADAATGAVRSDGQMVDAAVLRQLGPDD